LDVRSLSEESLLWDAPTPEQQDAYRRAFPGGPPRLRQFVPAWGLTVDRKAIYDRSKRNQAHVHGWFTDPDGIGAVRAAGLTLAADAPATINRGRDGRPTLEVHSVRPAHRVGPDGQTLTDLVVEITQWRRGYYDPQVQERADRGEIDPPWDFIFRGGCTLLVSLETARVRYCVYKRIRSEHRLEAQRRFLTRDTDSSLRATYFGDPRRRYFAGSDAEEREPFALLHRSYETEEVI
jgi:hypothetical protein